jgi:hypothetical protein
MDLIEFISQYGSWAWIVGGLILLAIEIFVPGGVFVWLGAAAIATGLFSFIIPMGWALQWALFGVLTIVGIVLWLKYGRKIINSETDSPFLNKRAKRFFGQKIVLEEAIIQGFGRVKLDDTTWRVAGKDLPKGTIVKVIDADGAILKVEKV